jgi:hypothetical protein
LNAIEETSPIATDPQTSALVAQDDLMHYNKKRLTQSAQGFSSNAKHRHPELRHAVKVLQDLGYVNSGLVHIMRRISPLSALSVSTMVPKPGLFVTPLSSDNPFNFLFTHCPENLKPLLAKRVKSSTDFMPIYTAVARVAKLLTMGSIDENGCSVSFFGPKIFPTCISHTPSVGATGIGYKSGVEGRGGKLTVFVETEKDQLTASRIVDLRTYNDPDTQTKVYPQILVQKIFPNTIPPQLSATDVSLQHYTFVVYGEVDLCFTILDIAEFLNRIPEEYARDLMINVFDNIFDETEVTSTTTSVR